MAFQAPPEVLLRQCLRSVSGRGKAVAASSGKLTKVPCGSRSYRAAVCTKLGSPLVLQEQPLPSKLESSQVLVSIHANGVNFADILTWQGKYQDRLKTPFVPGSEISGKVVAVGAGVGNVSKGDRVFVLGFNKAGGAAEYCVADCQSVLPVPDNLSLVEAASTIVNYGTAMMALTTKAKVKRHEHVLVTAAAGATGLAVTDIARNMFDCQVIAVCGGAEKCRFMRERGAQYTIDYTREKIRDKVKDITQGKGVSVALDQVGGDTLLECVKSLGFEGRALTIGYASGSIPSIPANQLLLKSSSLIGLFWGSYAGLHPSAFMESITQVLQGVSENKLHPYCGKTFPLEQINEAYQYILDRKSVGKVVIKVKDEEAPAE